LRKSGLSNKDACYLTAADIMVYAKHRRTERAAIVRAAQAVLERSAGNGVEQHCALEAR